MIFFNKNRETIHEIDKRLKRLEGSVSNDVLTQLDNISRQINRHDMAIENLLDELQEDIEDERNSRSAAEEQYRNSENLLTLFETCQDQFWQIKKFFSDKNDAFSSQFSLMEQSFSNAMIRCGITPVDRTGISVDYEIHEVIDLTESETYDKTVAEIYSPGYIYQGKIVKKAKISAYRKTISH
jgi:molecular chaperone GrpE (heat shock protein)